MAERIQLRRTRGWRLPEGAVVVARPTRWGNPWRVEPIYRPGIGRVYNLVRFKAHPLRQNGPTQVRTSAEARALVVQYRAAEIAFSAELQAEIRADLAGRDLACWCPLVDTEGNRMPCHADVLLEWANAPAEGDA
jgi:hypothetical protein